MTKEQFLKMYGQPNTVVSFKNEAEKMEFLKECEKFDVSSTKNIIDSIMSTSYCVNLNLGRTLSYSNIDWYVSKGFTAIPYKSYTPSPKSLIKDGWMGVQKRGEKVWFLPSIGIYVHDDEECFTIDTQYNDDLIMFSELDGEYKVMELYDNLGNLQWKREEKSAKDIEIERIQAEMNKLADDLSKLKGE